MRDTKRAAPEIPGAARFFDSCGTLANLGLILFQPNKFGRHNAKRGPRSAQTPPKKDNSRYLVLLDAHVAAELGAVVEDLAAGGAQLAAHRIEEDRL